MAVEKNVVLNLHYDLILVNRKDHSYTMMFPLITVSQNG
jgi:hypothetical protein